MHLTRILWVESSIIPENDCVEKLVSEWPFFPRCLIVATPFISIGIFRAGQATQIIFLGKIFRSQSAYCTY